LSRKKYILKIKELEMHKEKYYEGDNVWAVSDLMASGNPFQTVAMAARRVPDDFCCY
jgi:adenine/guanine phosphoribosyltransferase-like PRPP-binding protein